MPCWTSSGNHCHPHPAGNARPKPALPGPPEARTGCRDGGDHRGHDHPGGLSSGLPTEIMLHCLPYQAGSTLQAGRGLPLSACGWAQSRRL